MFYLCIRLITKHMDEITKIETVDQYDQLFGLETLHPLVNVIDFSKATKSVEYIRMNIGFYCLFLKDTVCRRVSFFIKINSVKGFITLSFFIIHKHS